MQSSSKVYARVKRTQMTELCYLEWIEIAALRTCESEFSFQKIIRISRFNTDRQLFQCTAKFYDFSGDALENADELLVKDS